MFLVDTNVISEARKGKRADPGVVGFWAEAARRDTPIFLASVTIGELRRGVELIRYRRDPQQTAPLEQWLQQVPNPQHLTDVTRNTADFAGCGVALLNPFSEA